MKKKLGSILLVMLLIFSMMQISVFPIYAATVSDDWLYLDGSKSGISASFDTSTGVLTISGTGEMPFYDRIDGSPPPWEDYREDITSVIIKNGVKNISSYAFALCTNMKTISIPNSVTSIDASAFLQCSKLTSITLASSITEIAFWAFNGCDSLENIYFQGKAPNVYAADSGWENADGYWVSTASFNKDLVTLHYLSGESGWTSPKWEGYKTTTYSANTSLSDDDNFNEAIAPKIMVQPSDIVVDQNEEAELYIEATVSKGSLSYQWYSNVTRSKSGGTPIRGETNNTYYPLTDGTFVMYYYCIVTNTDGDSSAYVISNPAEIRIKKKDTFKSDNTIRKKTIRFRSKVADEDSDKRPYYTNIEIDWGWDLFKNTSTDYNGDIAIASMALSTAAEDNGDAVGFMLQTLGFDNNKIRSYDYNTHIGQVKKVARTYAYQKVKYDNEEYNIFAIINRGTHDPSDVLTDVASLIDGFSAPSKVAASGFKKYVEEVTKKPYSQVTKENNKILITGHSLGGAIANNLSEELADFVPEKDMFVYTFAAPNTWVGLFNMNKLNKTNVYNIVNDEDIVTILPPTKDAKYGKSIPFHRKYVPGINNLFRTLTGGKDASFKIAHAPPIYMAYLLTKENWTINHSSSGFKLAKVKCPVDVDIIKTNGKSAGSIKNNIAKYTDVFIYVYGDEKYIYMPNDQIFDIQLLGTDEGEMEYSIVEFGGDSTVLREIVYDHVPLVKGIKYSGKVDKEINMAASDYNLISGDGDVIEYSYIIEENELSSASEWAHEGIKSAINKGFVPMELQNNYKSVITRAEFCRMAVKWVEYATGKSIDYILEEKGASRNSNAFSDTKDPDILAAFALGITSGTGNNSFSPEGQFTREQAATMVMNACKIIGANINNPMASGFDDINIASDWALNGINFVYSNGIMQGTGNNNFSPKLTYTREQSILTFDNIKSETLLKSTPTITPAKMGTVTIEYDSNGGFGQAPSHTVTKDKDGIAMYYLTESIPIRDGYDFLGWRFENSIDYDIDKPGDDITFDLGNPTTSEILTYYAQWEPIRQTQTASVSFSNMKAYWLDGYFAFSCDYIADGNVTKTGIAMTTRGGSRTISSDSNLSSDTYIVSNPYIQNGVDTSGGWKYGETYSWTAFVIVNGKRVESQTQSFVFSSPSGS